MALHHSVLIREKGQHLILAVCDVTWDEQSEQGQIEAAFCYCSGGLRDRVAVLRDPDTGDRYRVYLPQELVDLEQPARSYNAHIEVIGKPNVETPIFNRTQKKTTATDCGCGR